MYGKHHVSHVILVVLCLLQLSYGKITVLFPLASSNATVRIWPLKYDGNRVDFDPFDGEVVESTSENKTDKIIVIRNCAPPLEERYRSFQLEGAKAILCTVAGYPGSRPGHQMYSVDGSGSSDIIVPIVALRIGDLEKHWARGEPFIIRVETEPNEFMQVYESAWVSVWQFSMTCIIIYTFFFVLYRMYQLVSYHKRIKLNIAFFCLFMLLLATIAAFLGQSIDPLGVHNIFSYWLWEILFTAPFSLIMAPLMLMTLWWQKVMSSLKVAVNAGLSSYRWIFYTWIVLVFAQEIVGSLIRIINQETYVVISLVSATFYVINSVSVLVYCSITLHRLRRRVKGMMERSDYQGKELQKIRHRLITLIALIVVFCVIYLLFVARITEFPIARLVYWWIFWVIACMLITLQALTITPPRTSIADTQPTREYEPNRSRIQTRNRSVIAKLNALQSRDNLNRHVSAVTDEVMTEPSSESSFSDLDDAKNRLSERKKIAAKKQLKGWRSALGALKQTMWSSQSLTRPRLAQSAQPVRREPTFNKDVEDPEEKSELDSSEMLEAVEMMGKQEDTDKNSDEEDNED